MIRLISIILVLMIGSRIHSQNDKSILSDSALHRFLCLELDSKDIRVDDDKLFDEVWGIAFCFDDSGAFLGPDSTHYSGHLGIRFARRMACDSVSDWSHGVLSGSFKNGYKDGEWIERSNTAQGSMVITKKMNYKNGQLHGDYFVFGADREVIPHQEMHGNPFAPTSTFEKGTGMYVDFYNFPPYQLKVCGRLVNGRREGRWNVYDKDGDVVVSYIFRNGVCINL